MDGNELIQAIGKIYFENEENFNLDHLTNKLPANLTSDYLLEYKESLEKLLSAVTKKVSELILSHQPAYVDELKRIADLQESITHSIRACTQGRACLRFIKDGTAKNGTTIVEHYRKRESLAKLLNSMTAISELRALVFDIRALIDSQDFPKAIQMCKDGKTLLASFQQYKCVEELGSKLVDTVEFIGEQVDTVMSKMCLSYDPDTYEKLQTTYVLMDRSEIAIDQLLMHFCSAINSQAHNIVIKHLNPTETELKKDFFEMCKLLTSEQFMLSLIEVCATYRLIMMNYKKILKWHENQEVKIDGQKLIGGTNRLWYDMKRKLCILISSHDFSGYTFDDFIKILNVVDSLMKLGNEFCGGELLSNDLLDCINTQALNFFKSYHKSSVDELKMFLDSELWEMVPVKVDFKLVQLKEFSFLRSISDNEPTDTPGSFFSYEEALPLDKISLSTDSDDDLEKDFVEEDDVLSSDEEQSNEHVNKPENITSSPSHGSNLTKTSGPVLTNSSLNVLRLFGRYIQMMSVLEPISYEILISIYNLLDHYTVAVYKKFGPDSGDKKEDDKNISPKLRIVIRSIRENLIGSQSVIDDQASQSKPGETNLTVQQGVPNVTSLITNDLKTAGKSKSGDKIDPKKAVAIESLIFLVNQLWNLQKYLESLIPAELRPQLKEQFSQSQSIVPDFLKARAEVGSSSYS